MNKKCLLFSRQELKKDLIGEKNKRPTLDDICDMIIFINRDEYYNADYVIDGNLYGPTYTPKYSKVLPKVDVELIASKNKNSLKYKTAHLFSNRNNGNYFE